MSLFEGLEKSEVIFSPNHREAPRGNLPISLAIGIFDGVHLGHQAVIKQTIQDAANRNGLSGVLTFEPHPSRVLRPDKATRMILDIPRKTYCIFQLGIDFVLLKQFDKEFAELEAEAFLPYLKQKLPTLESIHVGSNFQFGKGRKGDLSVLEASGGKLNVEVHGFERIHHESHLISSSRIRKALESGRIEEANTMLGWKYQTLTHVVEGSRLGREIGVPTLNFKWDPELRPRFGVYAVRLNDPENQEIDIPGVANYGIRPTVAADNSPTLEVHAFQPVEYQSGKVLKVTWESFLRDEQHFEDLDSLKAQIARDIQNARAMWESYQE